MPPPAQRAEWHVSGAGYGIHWPRLDEDLTTQGLYRALLLPGEKKKPLSTACAPRSVGGVFGEHECMTRHDLYINPKTGKKQPVPRHDEIDEHLAKHIRIGDE